MRRLGAAGANARAERLHASATYGILRMDVYAFEAAGDSIAGASPEVKVLAQEPTR